MAKSTRDKVKKIVDECIIGTSSSKTVFDIMKIIEKEKFDVMNLDMPKKRISLIVKEWFEIKTDVEISNDTLMKLVNDIFKKDE